MNSKFLFILSFLTIFLLISNSFYAQTAGSVEDAQKQIDAKRKADAKIAKKAQKEAQRAHWDRQSPQAKKSIKKNKKRNKKMKRQVKKKQCLQRKYSGRN